MLSSAVSPPTAGPSESTVSRWPSRIPSAANGNSPTRRSAIISIQLCRREPDAERGARDGEHRNRQQSRQVRSEDLRRQVAARREGRQPKLARPPDAAVECDPGAAGDDRVHRPERSQADHQIERRGHTAAAQIGLVLVRPGDQVIEDEREAEREHEEPAIPEQPDELVANVRRPDVHTRSGAGKAGTSAICEPPSSLRLTPPPRRGSARGTPPRIPRP